MSVYIFKREQFINASKKDVWNFISSPLNLKLITPPSMGFSIMSEVPENMYAGLIIEYKVKPLFGIQTTWLTEITQVEEFEYFIDEQRVGPYSLWHHQHFIEEHNNGVMMKDVIHYQLPMGILGVFVNHVLVKHKLNEIFEFRQEKIKEYLG